MELREAYGFDDVSIVPGDVTINPELVDTSFEIGGFKFSFPIIASAMDGVVDVDFAIKMGRLGGLAVLNLEGIQTRYDDPREVLEEIAQASDEEATSLLQKIYSEPVKERLIGERVEAIKRGGVVCAVAITPQNTKKFSKIALEAGMDILFVQSTVTTARHISRSPRGLILSELKESLKVPIVVGNCVSYSAARELMETGIDGVLIGVGPGAACTTREVLGVGVPQITATMDSARARDDYFKETGRYIPIITDGGFRNSGDICKAIAAGADAVMLGSLFASTHEAPGCGYHWGMSTFHPSLPRGTRVKVGRTCSLEELLFGPSSRTDGTLNLVGALKVCMGICGASNIKELQKAKLIYSPSVKTEGKHLQLKNPNL